MISNFPPDEEDSPNLDSKENIYIFREKITTFFFIMINC